MVITRFHMSLTLLIALLLHISLAVSLSLFTPEPLPKPAAPMRLSVLMPVAEKTVVEASSEAKPPPPKKITKKPPPEPKRFTEPEPEIIEPEPEVVEQESPAPMEDKVAPLDAASSLRYEQLLVAWLEKHKKYPRRAKRLRIEGEAVVRILIDRGGNTRQVVLEQGTGNRVLDKEVLAMAKRADPFPSMPEHDPRQELEFMVPVAFLLH